VSIELDYDSIRQSFLGSEIRAVNSDVSSPCGHYLVIYLNH